MVYTHHTQGGIYTRVYLSSLSHTRVYLSSVSHIPSWFYRGFENCRSPPVSILRVETTDILIPGYGREATLGGEKSTLRNIINFSQKDGPGPMGEASS